MMTKSEIRCCCRCMSIFKALSRKEEYIDDLDTKEFKNLEKLNIRFEYNKEGEKKYNKKYDTLSFIHFSIDETDFLPNEKLYWLYLKDGEYERIVNELYSTFVNFKLRKTLPLEK